MIKEKSIKKREDLLRRLDLIESTIDYIIWLDDRRKLLQEELDDMRMEHKKDTINYKKSQP